MHRDRKPVCDGYITADDSADPDRGRKRRDASPFTALGQVTVGGAEGVDHCLLDARAGETRAGLGEGRQIEPIRL